MVRTAILWAGIIAGLGVGRPALSQDWSPPQWLMSPQQTSAFSRDREFVRSTEALRAPNPNAQQSDLLKKVVQFYLSQLTHPDVENPAKDVVDALLNRYINMSLGSPTSRTVMMDEVLARVPELLQHPDSVVRTNAVLLVGQLNVRANIPYNPAHALLIEVLKDSNQLIECRITAAFGLTRICRDGENVASIERSDIANALVETLDSVTPSAQDQVWWFRYRMIEALGHVNRIDNVQGTPVVIDTLVKLIGNRQEVWINRAMAARSCTQLEWPGNTNVPLITYEIMSLLRDMASQSRRPPREAFVSVYLSFKPATLPQARDRKWGLLYEVERTGLGGHAVYVQGAWNAAFPLLKPFVEGTGGAAIQEPVLRALNEWLSNNTPENRQVVPNGQEIPVRTASSS